MRQHYGTVAYDVLLGAGFDDRKFKRPTFFDNLEGVVKLLIEENDNELIKNAPDEVVVKYGDSVLRYYYIPLSQALHLWLQDGMPTPTDNDDEKPHNISTPGVVFNLMEAFAGGI